MIKICEYIVGWLLDENDDDKKELYMYEIYHYVSTVSFILCIGIVSVFILKSLMPIIFSITLASLRKYSGGFHLNNADICFLYSIIITVIGFYMSNYLVNNYSDSKLLFLTISITILIAITILSPINHPNLHLTKVEATAMKRKIADISGIICCFLFFSLFISVKIFFGIFTAISTDFILILLAKLFHQEMEYL